MTEMRNPTTGTMYKLQIWLKNLIDKNRMPSKNMELVINYYVLDQNDDIFAERRMKPIQLQIDIFHVSNWQVST